MIGTGVPGGILENFIHGPWTTLISSDSLQHELSSGTHNVWIARTLLSWVNLCKKKKRLLLKSYWSLPLWPHNGLSNMLHLSLLIRFEPRWPLCDIQLNFITLDNTNLELSLIQVYSWDGKKEFITNLNSDLSHNGVFLEISCKIRKFELPISFNL